MKEIEGKMPFKPSWVSNTAQTRYLFLKKLASMCIDILGEVSRVTAERGINVNKPKLT